MGATAASIDDSLGTCFSPGTSFDVRSSTSTLSTEVRDTGSLGISGTRTDTTGSFFVAVGAAMTGAGSGDDMAGGVTASSSVLVATATALETPSRSCEGACMGLSAGAA